MHPIGIKSSMAVTRKLTKVSPISRRLKIHIGREIKQHMKEEANVSPYYNASTK